MQQANTDLVTARAAQHTLNQTDVVKIAGDAREAASQARSVQKLP